MQLMQYGTNTSLTAKIGKLKKQRLAPEVDFIIILQATFVPLYLHLSYWFTA